MYEVQNSSFDADANFAALLPRVSVPPSSDAIVRPSMKYGDLVVLSGQVAFVESELLSVGRLGDEVELEVGVRCARQCAVNLLGRIQEEFGSLSFIRQVLKLTVFVSSSPGFREQPIVANGASEVFTEVLGNCGKHARSAVGVAELPLGTPVEVEAMIVIGE